MSYCAKCGCETTGKKNCPVCNTPVESGFEDAYAVGSQTVATAAACSDEGEPIPTFVGAFTRFWEKAFNGSGRASRTEYWYVAIWQTIITGPLVLWYFMELRRYGFERPYFSITLLGIVGLYAFFSLAPTFNLTVRRLHDANAPGWFVVLYFVRDVRFFIPLAIGLFPPTRGPNKYGPPPRRGE